MMKLLIISLCALGLQVSANSYSQGISLNLQRASLSAAFKEIQQQCEYRFIYTNEELQNAGTVTITVMHASLQQVLDLCFRDQPLTYTINDKYIVVKEKKPKFQLVPVTDKNVQGRVSGEKGEPLAGATVALKASNRATATDGRGMFELQDIPEGSVLVISSIGYEPREIIIGNNRVLDIHLVLAVSGLDEMVVKGYYNTSRRLNTGNVSKINAEAISRQPVSNPLAAMEGLAPGIYITQNTGVPGGSFTIQIRGQNSLRNTSVNNGNLPLYIIDGVPYAAVTTTDNIAAASIIPMQSPLNDINPSDIESIEVLKDADATAIYGSRGANGVILISTKKGKSGKTTVNANVFTGAGNITRNMKLLTTQQYLQMRHEAYQNDNASLQSYAYDLNGGWDTTRYTNWQKTLIGNTASITNAQLSVSGGNANTQFIFGSAYFYQGTVFPGNFAEKKISGHISLNHRSENNRFQLGVSVNYVKDNNDLPSADPTNPALTLAPVAPQTYNANGSLNWQNSSWNNPMSIFLKKYANSTNNIIASSIISYRIATGLDIKLNAGYNFLQMAEKRIFPIKSSNPAYNPTGSLIISNSSIGTWIAEPQMEYKKNISKGIFSVLIGSTFQESITQSQSVIGVGYTSDLLLQNLQSAPSIFALNSTNTQYRYNAIFGRISYNWDDQYLINLTGRRDGSSRFGPGNQFANYGAAGAGWIFSKTSGFQKFRALSYGKLRASYGLTGSDQIGDYGYLDTYSVTSYPYNGSGGLTVTRLVNPDYSWEINKKFEASLDLGFLKDRILLSLVFYTNRSSNQLVGLSLPVITGQSSITANLPATVQNNGWELELTTINIRKESFTWTTAINITIPQNKLIAFPNLSGSSYANTYVIGKPLGIIKAYHLTGVDIQKGIYMFEDVDKDGRISYPNDLQALTSIARKYFGGIQNMIAYKRFQLSCLFQFVKQTGRNYRSVYSSPGSMSNQPTEVMNRWQKPGDITSIQQFTQGGAAQTAYANASYDSDASIDDASFIRLKNLYLSYQIPAKWQQSLHLQNIKIYAQAQNLLTFTKYKGIDPENQSFYSLPPLRIITAGIQILF